MIEPYQQKVIDSCSARHGIWAKPGAGKTLMTIELAKRHTDSGVLVITTKSLKYNWEREIKMWDPNPGSRYYVVCSKEEFKRNWNTLFANLKTIIFDEAHYGAYPTNQIHKTLLKYRQQYKVEHLWLATATPILSNVMSVWGLSNLMGKPLGSYMAFKMKYFKKIKMGTREVWIQKNGTQDMLSDDLNSIGISVDIPDKYPVVHDFEYFKMTPEQEKAVKQLDEDPTTITPIVWANKYLQIANGTLKKTGKNEYIKCDKVNRLLEIIESDPGVMIVCRQTAELEMLHELIPNSKIYNGDTSPEDRETIVQETNEGKCIMLLQAECGVGFNLPNIRTVVFYSHSWSFVSYTQSLGRNGGRRQLGPNRYIHLITADTPDEAVWKSLENKKTFDAALYKVSIM